MTDTTAQPGGDVMPTGINVDRMAWVRRLQLLLDANPASLPGTLDDALFEFVDQAMTVARMQALLDVTEFDPADSATHPQDGQVVAVLVRFSGGCEEIDGGEPWWSSPGGTDRWLWVPPGATDG